MADLCGRRRVFRSGVLLFVAGSFVGAFATDIVMLDLSRAVAGMGAATALTSGSAVLAAKFEDGPVRRPPAVGPGMAAGMFNTVRLASETATIAVVGSLLVTVTQSRLVSHVPSARAAAQAANSGSLSSLAAPIRGLAASALIGALHDVLWLLAACAVIATPVVTLTLGSRSGPGLPPAPEVVEDLVADAAV